VIIPIGTSGCFAHRPWGTAAIVLANAIVAFTLGMVEPALSWFEPGPALDSWILDYHGFTPLQWVASAFVHANLLHLAGNMIFLLVFGIIVEGAVGWRRFLPLYLGLAAAQGLVEQLLFTHGGSYGASGAIYAITAIAMLWAPRQKVRIFVWVYRWVGTHEVEVRALVGWFVGWQFLYALFWGFRLGTPMLHLMGAVLGFIAGWVMLRRGWVDCQGEDWPSLRAAARAAEAAAVARRGEEPRPLPEVPRETPEELLASFLRFAWPVAGSVLIGVGLIRIFTLNWSETARVDRNVGVTVVCMLAIAAGAWVLRRWREA